MSRTRSTQRSVNAALAVDDSAVVRWGLTAGLLECGIDTVNTAATATEALAIIRDSVESHALALVGSVVDQPVTTLTRLLAHHHRCAVVVFLPRRETNLTLTVLRAGALAVLERDARSLDLSAAVDAALGRRRHLAPGLIDGLAGEIERPSTSGRGTNLTPREREVLDLVSAGHTNAEIASRLCISDETVKSHLTRLFQKFGVHRRTELLASALRHGLI